MAPTNERRPDSDRSDQGDDSPKPSERSPIHKSSASPDSQRRPTQTRPPEHANDLPLGVVLRSDDPASASYLDLLEEADTLFLSHEYIRAIEFAERAHGLNPTDRRGIELRDRIRATANELQSCLDRGQSLVDSGRAGVAIPLLRRAQVLQPHNASIRDRIEDAERRHVAERRATSRAFVEGKRYRRAAEAVAEAATTSGDPRDRRRATRCRRAASGRARFSLVRIACFALAAPVLLVGILQSRDAIALVRLAAPVLAGDIAAGRDALTAEGSSSAVGSATRQRLLASLSTASIRAAIRDGRFEDADRLALLATCDPNDSDATRCLCSASKLVSQGRFEDASNAIASLATNSSEVVRMAGMQLLADIRRRILETALSLEKAGKFEEESRELDRLGATGTFVKGGEEDVRRDLAIAVAECVRLQSAAGDDLQRWLGLDEKRRSLVARVNDEASVLRERGGDGFTAALAEVEVVVLERIPDAAKRRALTIRTQLDRAAPRPDEDDATAIAFLEAVRDIRVRLSADRYRPLATSLSTILR